MNRFLFILLSFLTAAVASAEQADTTQTAANAGQQAKPARLIVNADVSMRPGSNYHLKHHGNEVARDESKAFSKAVVRGSYQVFKQGYTRIDVGAQYAFYHQNFGNNEAMTARGFDHHSHHAMNLNAKATTYLRLMGKPLMLSAMARTDFSEYGYERWGASLTAMLMLKHTKETTLGVGLIGSIHSATRIPVIPMITYRHVFNPQWTVNMVMPKFQMEYHPTAADMLTAGVTIDADSYFLKTDGGELPRHIQYNRTNVNIGPGYEHLFPCGLALRAEAGAQWIIADRMYSRNSNHVVSRMHEKVSPYACVGVVWKM